MENIEIKFRALESKSKNWVYGIPLYGNLDITFTEMQVFENNKHGILEIDSKTLGQFTGLKDKNGVDIYKGDIVNIDGFVGVIYFRYDRWHCKDKNNIDYDNGDYYHGDDVLWLKVEIIGNIHDNPELLNSNP